MMPTHKKLLALLITVLVASCLIIYLSENIKTERPRKIIRVACIGDSITEWSKYPDRLQLILGANYEVKNFGVAGSAVLRSSDKPYMNQEAFFASKNFDPDIVIIMLGTNDAKGQNYRSIASFSGDYEDLIKEYDSLPEDQQIWIVTPPPIFNDSLGPKNTNLEKGVIPSIGQVANDLELPTINVNEAFQNHPDYFVDGVHPNDQGADLIANIISDTINFD
jgi:lysophospholipase L1-like esterase